MNRSYFLAPWLILYGFVGMVTWIFAAAFHARATYWTERLDYHSALALVLVQTIIVAMRAFHLRGFLPAAILSAVALAIFVPLVVYMNTVLFDYGLNVKISIAIALIGIAIQSWLTGASVWDAWQGKVPWKAIRYCWKGIASMILIAVLTAVFEVNDFPPLFMGVGDAHSFWHIFTVPVGFLWYSYLCDDLKYLNGRYGTQKLRETNRYMNSVYRTWMWINDPAMYEVLELMKARKLEKMRGGTSAMKEAREKKKREKAKKKDDNNPWGSGNEEESEDEIEAFTAVNPSKPNSRANRRRKVASKVVGDGDSESDDGIESRGGHPDVFKKISEDMHRHPGDVNAGAHGHGHGHGHDFGHYDGDMEGSDDEESRKPAGCPFFDEEAEADFARAILGEEAWKARMMHAHGTKGIMVDPNEATKAIKNRIESQQVVSDSLTETSSSEEETEVTQSLKHPIGEEIPESID